MYKEPRGRRRHARAFCATASADAKNILMMGERCRVALPMSAASHLGHGMQRVAPGRER